MSFSASDGEKVAAGRMRCRRTNCFLVFAPRVRCRFWACSEFRVPGFGRTDAFEQVTEKTERCGIWSHTTAESSLSASIGESSPVGYCTSVDSRSLHPQIAETKRV